LIGKLGFLDVFLSLADLLFEKEEKILDFEFFETAIARLMILIF
jgi:hypothetical protein